MSEEEILSQVDALQPTEAHIVGGLNQVWPYERNLKLVRRLRQVYPELHIKAFTAVEIAYFAKTVRKSEAQILEELKAAGMNAMPGGGAEIFSDRLYRQHWKNKIGPKEWVRIHRATYWAWGWVPSLKTGRSRSSLPSMNGRRVWPWTWGGVGRPR